MTTETFSNNATSPLAVSVTTTPAQGTQETWTVNSTSSFPQTPGQARFIIDNEIVIGVTPPASGTTLVVTRGAEGTTPATHAAGIQLKQDATAGSLGVFLQTDTTVSTPSTTVLGARVTTDTFDRIQIRPQGFFLGTGTAAPDTGFVRVSGWNVDPGAGNVGFIGGDISLPHTGNPSIACGDATFGFGTSTGGWSSDTAAGDLFVGAASTTNKILFGNAASGGPSWAQVSATGFNLSMPISITSFAPQLILTGNSDYGVLRLAGATGNGGAIEFWEGSTKRWSLYDDPTTGVLHLQDAAHSSRDHITITPGATSLAALTRLASRLQVDDHIYVSELDIVSSGTTAAYGWYYGGSGQMAGWDYTNNRNQIIFFPGASDVLALTEFHSSLLVDGGLRTSQASISATSPITATTTLVNATSGAITATLPSVAAGLRCEVKKTDASANAVTVTPATGTIDGAASFILVGQYDAVTVVSDGTNWWVV